MRVLLAGGDGGSKRYRQIYGVPCMQFSWSSSSQQSRTSASATYVVTPAGLPVTYSYGENNPMGGSGISVAFDFQAAKLAPTAC